MLKPVLEREERRGRKIANFTLKVTAEIKTNALIEPR
jgi:hypothetical protein